MESASFGEWVRRRRRSLDLTQAELAARVACAPITVRKIESDERRPSKVMAERLAEALELEPEARDRLVAAARAVVSPVRLDAPVSGPEFGPGGVAPSPPHRLVGRTRELTDVVELLRLSGGPARLVTVTGPPGVGKTRFALEVGDRCQRKLDVPVLFVDLSLVSDAGDVPARIAAAVSTPSAALVDAMTLAVHALRRAPALVVLDNFEHVLPAADAVEMLLASCPDLVALVTSRAPLELYAEHRYPLRPLPVDADPDDPDDPDGPDASSSAVALFLERARAVDPELALDEGPDREAALDVCRAVDGLPLALELAARRVGDLPLATLAHRLREGDQPLGEGPRGATTRQRSADGAIAWGYELLSTNARAVLLAASVFPGWFDATGVAAVLGVDPEVPDRPRSTAFDGGPRTVTEVGTALGELAHQALVRAGPPVDEGPRHYGALMVVREFGRRRLAESGALDAARAGHAGFVVALVEAVSPGIDAWPEREELEALEALDPDVRAALAWSFGDGGDPAVGRRLVGAILPLWYFRGQVADSVRWAEAAYDSLLPADRGPDRYRSAYHLAASRWSAGDLDGAAPVIDEAIAGAEAADDVTWLAEAVGMKQMLALTAGDLGAAEALAPRCVATAERAGGEWLLLAHLRSARLALFRGDLAAAATHAAASAAAAEQRPSTWARANVTGLRGDVALAGGDAATAVEHYLAALEACLAVDATVMAVARVSSVANALAVAGETERAAAAYGLVDAWCEDLGAPLHPTAAFAHAVHRSAVEDELGPSWPDAAARGRDLPRRADAVRGLAEPVATPVTAE